MMIAHRGTRPENKLVAFRECIARKARAIECDVRLSKDNKAIIIHDHILNRVTPIKGNVNNMISDDLKQYDIPLFQDILDLLKPHPDIHLFVELKDVGRKNAILVHEVLNSINNMDMVSTCSVISFQPTILKLVKTLCPRIRTGYIYGPLRGRNPFVKVRECNADMLWLHHRLVTTAIVTNGVPIFAWTVNDEYIIKTLKDMGVSGIITDVPEYLTSI